MTCDDVNDVQLSKQIWFNLTISWADSWVIDNQLMSLMSQEGGCVAMGPLQRRYPPF